MKDSVCQYDFTDVEYGALNTGAWRHDEETLVAKRMNLEHLTDDHYIVQSFFLMTILSQMLLGDSPQNYCMLIWEY